MPCSDGGPSWEDERRAAREKQERLDQATRLLCEVMTQYEEDGPGNEFYPSAELQTWWERHKKEDAARKKIEEERKAAQIKYDAQRILKLEAEIEEIRNKNGYRDELKKSAGKKRPTGPTKKKG